ncbi:MAG: alpha/beta hydrolase [Lutibacter sp.]|nr:alpha/beta hydrolase [Lutibacter sp.]
MNLKSSHIIFFFLVFAFHVNSQQMKTIDTSYTVYSSYTKYLKKFPEIEIVNPQIFDNVVEKKEIVYNEIGERKLHLDAFYNKSKELKPAVILVHGGGWKSGNKLHMQPMAQHIASNGYACFSVEYRLSPEAIFPAGIFDIKNAIQFIKEHSKEFNIDVTKIAILGCSSGGQMAALIGATNNNVNFEEGNSKYNQSSEVNAIIDIDGILAFNHPESEEGEMASLWLGGNSKDKIETWTEASALSHTNKNTPPILFIGSQYPRFLAGKDDMIEILNKYSIFNQAEKIENSPHSFWLFHPWFKETVQYITNFLDKIFKEK